MFGKWFARKLPCYLYKSNRPRPFPVFLFSNIATNIWISSSTGSPSLCITLNTESMKPIDKNVFTEFLYCKKVPLDWNQSRKCCISWKQPAWLVRNLISCKLLVSPHLTFSEQLTWLCPLTQHRGPLLSIELRALRLSAYSLISSVCLSLMVCERQRQKVKVN